MRVQPLKYIPHRPILAARIHRLENNQHFVPTLRNQTRLQLAQPQPRVLHHDHPVVLR